MTLGFEPRHYYSTHTKTISFKQLVVVFNFDDNGDNVGQLFSCCYC